MDVTTPRQIGNSSLSVTPLGFGGGQLGSPFVTNDESLKTIQSAWDNGVRFYDTAPYYGLGRSERRLGMALTGGVERGAVVFVPGVDESRILGK